SESKEGMSNNSRARILVVDDDAISRKILAQLLASAGHDSRECEDGAKALQLIHAKPPSLLLLDFDMPGLNGAEVLRRLRSDADSAVEQIHTTMLTGKGSAESAVSCLTAGPDEFVIKKINDAQI